jgi:hypothetical protein
MAMDGGAMPQRLGTESVTDYWVGNVPGLPSNPLLRSNGLGGAGMSTVFKSLSARVDSAAARMGSALALRTSSNTRVVLGPGQILESQQSAVVSDLERRTVDEKLLVTPATFHKIAPPM